jgi:hypothetical protein
MALETDGYIPNVGNLAVQPGSILGRRRGRYDVVGTLWERVHPKDAQLAQTIKEATERLTPGDLAGDNTKHKLGLKFKAGGTVMVASDTAFDLEVSGVPLKANIKVDFKRRRDFLFDTTSPVPWYTFDDAVMDDVRRGALEYLSNGEYIVIGAAYASRWLWYVSRSRNTTLAFSVTAPNISGLGVDKLADLKANSGLSLVADSSSIVNGEGIDSVAAFRVLRKRTGRLAPRAVPEPELVSVDGKHVNPSDTAALSEPDDEERIDLAFIPDEEDDIEE